jgi:Mg2+ and Co2+ transporter CorA
MNEKDEYIKEIGKQLDDYTKDFYMNLIKDIEYYIKSIGDDLLKMQFPFPSYEWEDNCFISKKTDDIFNHLYEISKIVMEINNKFKDKFNREGDEK